MTGMVIAAAAAMVTAWGEKVTPENAWRDYPRPQMVREGWQNLNGSWDYAVTKIKDTAGEPAKYDGKILVPFGIESALSGVGRLLEPDEFLWYSRTLNVRKEPGRRILLNFESVDYRAQVFIGHREVMLPHESLNVPFSVDVTDYVEDGDNRLVVCVWDPTDTGMTGATGKQCLKPGGCFYTRCSGIIGTVWTESVPETYIESYRVTPDLSADEAVFNVKPSGYGVAECEVKILDSGELVASAKGVPGRDIRVKMPEGYSKWSPDFPALYDVEISLGDDRVKGYFGMRSISKDRDSSGTLRYFLNGKPLFILATLDQGWWPDGLLTPPSAEAAEHDIRTLRDCGFNAMRKHIKVENRVYYSLCDRLGLLVLQDMPSDPPPDMNTPAFDKGMGTDTSRYGFFRRDLARIMETLHNTPSIVEWIPYNEFWGQPSEFLTHCTLDWVRAADPSRLVGGPSGWNDFEGGRIRDSYTAWDKWKDTEHRPDGVCEAADTIDKHDYGKTITVFPKNDRRISFLGEFGGVNYKVEGHLWNEKGHFGYEQSDSLEGLEAAYAGLIHQLRALVPGGLSGCVYTQTTDVEIETNGLMTYDRRVLKFDPARIRAINRRLIDTLGE